MIFKKTQYFLFISFLFISFCSCLKEKEVNSIQYSGNYNLDFNDKNDFHLESAQSIGILPVENRDEAEHLKKQLREIKAGKNFEIDELTHSIPFVVPQTELLINKIADNFADSLKSLNAPHYKIIITSITRTKEDVKRLGQKNINASLNSAHMYGTTIDISWKRFIKTGKNKTNLTDEQLKMVLAMVLRDLKKEGLCYIKHEKKQACFHITAR